MVIIEIIIICCRNVLGTAAPEVATSLWSQRTQVAYQAGMSERFYLYSIFLAMANTIQKAAVFGNTSAEARRRVIGLYRAWYRDVSTCASTEWQVLLLGPTKYHCPLPLLLTAAFDTCVSFGPRLRTIKLLLCPPRVRALTKPKQRKGNCFLRRG